MTHLYEYKDNADFKYGNNIENQLTEGVGYAYGTELFLNKKIGDFTGWIGYTLAWTRRYFPELNAGIEFYPRYDKRHDISIVLNYEFSNNFNSSATWTYGTGEAFALPVNQFLLLNPALHLLPKTILIMIIQAGISSDYRLSINWIFLSIIILNYSVKQFSFRLIFTMPITTIMLLQNILAIKLIR